MKQYLFYDTGEQKTFELVLNILNSKGEPTGKTRSYGSDRAYDIWKFYMKHRGGIGRKKSGGTIDAKTAEKILQTLYKD